MSRIGKKPISIPSQVSIEIVGNTVKINGPKGELQRDINPDMKIVRENDQLTVQRSGDDKQNRSMHGLTRTLISNMVEGVTKGFSKGLDINGIGYKAALQGKKLVLTVGYSHPVEVEPPVGISFEVPAVNKIIVNGSNKELVGQVAAYIRSIREPEPYKGKGIKYEKEVIRRKAGKAGKTK